MVQTRSMKQKKLTKKNSQAKATSLQKSLRPQRKAAQKASLNLAQNRNLYFNSGKTPVLTKTGEKADSTSLARARWNRKSDETRNGTTFEGWKKGREAHHLIPSEAFRSYQFPKGFINSAENGIMLPSGREHSHGLRNKDLDKGKVTHVRGGKGNHTNYNKQVKRFLSSKYEKGEQISLEDATSIARTLRLAHRKEKKDAEYVEDISAFSLLSASAKPKVSRIS